MSFYVERNFTPFFLIVQMLKLSRLLCKILKFKNILRKIQPLKSLHPTLSKSHQLLLLYSSTSTALPKSLPLTMYAQKSL